MVRASSTGSESTVAGIGRLVASAQAREAPIQRLADSVSGIFCYSVMAASAITFAFWSMAGSSSIRSDIIHTTAELCQVAEKKPPRFSIEQTFPWSSHPDFAALWTSLLMYITSNEFYCKESYYTSSGSRDYIAVSVSNFGLSEFLACKGDSC